MTTRQLFFLLWFYLGLLSLVLYFTRPRKPRLLGALAGGVVGSAINLGGLLVGVQQGWWQVPLHWAPGFLALLWLVSVIACGFVFLLTWRVARRFGRRGIAVAIVAAALLGPVRTYLAAAVFPAWISLAPGFVPMLVIAVMFAGWVAAGHAMMRLVAGAAQKDSFAQRPWDAA